MNEITGDSNIFAYHSTEMNGSCGNSYALPKEDRKLVSISYHRPHPLERKIVFSVKPLENDFDACISKVLIPGIRKILDLLNKILNEVKNKKEYLDELKRIK